MIEKKDLCDVELHIDLEQNLNNGNVKILRFGSKFKIRGAKWEDLIKFCESVI